MAKFCFECGKPVQTDWKVCPECGTAIVGAPKVLQSPPTPLPQYQQPYSHLTQKKSSREQLITYAWIFPFIATVIGMLSFLGPYAYAKLYDNYGILDVSIDYWWFGVGSAYFYGYGTQFFGWEFTDAVGAAYLFTIIITFFIVALLNMFGLIRGISLRKRERKFSSSLLATGIGIIVTSVIFITLLNVISITMDTGQPYFILLNPGFPIIWQFIGAGLIITGYFIGKMKPKVVRE